MKKIVCQLTCFMLSLLYTFSLRAEPRMLDRLILEINGKSFSQRQIEIYHSVRTIAGGSRSRKALLDTATWKSAVETFKNEMIVFASIEGDQTRNDSFQADNRALQWAEKEIQKVQLEDKELLAFFKRQGVTEAELQKNLVTIFRIQAYVRSRLQVLNQDSDLSAKDLLDIDPDSDWFASMQKATPYRFYDRAKEFQALQVARKG